MVKKSIPRLVVFFDTNALYTQVASDLVRAEIRNLITQNSNHVDLDISWYLPEIVVNERRYQMMSRAQDLLPNLQKMEKLLGLTFGIGDGTLELHVGKAIDDTIRQLSFNVAKLDANKVDWGDVISRATLRYPPFERGDKEKGFRDSVIANTFAQFHENSPSTPTVCRLAIVTNDELLAEYINLLTAGSKNVRILKGTDELESLINTLVSSVSEEYAAELTKKATKLFFVKDEEKSLYYKDNIAEKIKLKYAEVLKDTILKDHLRRSGTWWITQTIFVKKVRQRIHWVSVIEPEFEIYHIENKSQDSAFTSSLSKLAGMEPATAKYWSLVNEGIIQAKPQVIKQGLLGTTFADTEIIVDHKGRDRFEVQWSANITPSKNLTKPTIDEIKYMGNNLNSDS
ncbi:PIN domain-containing protein [uncultured Nitrosomonas sp.]|uniref:PIN domain-containing protein n=1 Tax=uncultured Nitrosomonas sp. TaxID=156424 RepID=UPI0025F69883|nr:PIN domain-containing protein [uncultured Nitrosomonas sp.]